MKFSFKNLPGRKRDYFLLSLVSIDILALLIRANYEQFLDHSFVLGTIYFDWTVAFLWFLNFINRVRKDKLGGGKYIRTHWYELIGMIPLAPLRPFLLLRGVKLAIAYYKLGRSEQDVSRLVTRELTFRFRDVIVDTIADAVFLQSLDRVEEVMMRLDYANLARRAFQENQVELKKAVHESLYSKSAIGALSKIPLLGSVANTLGDDVTRIITEILETEVTGKIIKGITAGILEEMNERVKLLDLERITGTKFPLKGNGPTTEG